MVDRSRAARRVLVVGWSSVLHGEATAGDVLSMAAVAAALHGAGWAVDTAWSAVMRPAGGLALDDADPAAYSHLVFACGPLHGRPVQELHRRFAGCRRLAVGVSVIDPADPAVTGFDVVIARDVDGGAGRRDLAATVDVPSVPVVGVFLTHGQQEYGGRRRHESVTEVLGAWLRTRPEATLDLDTRLDPRDWRLAVDPAQLESVVRRLDAVVTTRLHGLVLALKNGVPAVVVDPVSGGAKVTAQARAWGWPVLDADEVGAVALDAALTVALSTAGRDAAYAARQAAAGGSGTGAARRGDPGGTGDPQTDALLAALAVDR